MATKAQIARKKYGESLSYLSAGQKAAVTRAFNAQGATSVSTSGGNVSVKFVRTGGREIISKVPAGSTYEAALANVTGFQFNADKEGLQTLSGTTIGLNDVAKTGNVIVAPNVDSAC